MTTRLLVGDVFDRMAELPDASFDLIVTSPPFLALRSYLPEDHPQKHLEIGSEPNPAAYLDVLLALTAEWRRLLAPHGSLAVELGDTYAGSGGAGGDYDNGGFRDSQARFNGAAAKARAHAIKERTRSPGPGWPLDKSLCGIPTLYAWSLAYGRNLLTGQPSPAGMWRVRNVKPWIRSNPPVGALGDKERPATSYITVACAGGSRWFDLDSARTPRASRATDGAVVGVPDAGVVPSTLLADGRSSLRGWCQPGDSKIAVGPAVTWQAKRLQVVEPVGFLVGVEQIVGPKMMDLQSTVATADATAVAVAVESCLAGSVPVASPVIGASAVPSGIVLASDIDAPPFAGTLATAEVVSQDLALVAGEWLAARIALKLDGADATAYAIAPLAGSELSLGHSEQSSSNHNGSGGAPPLDWWHHVDAIIDHEIDHGVSRQLDDLTDDELNELSDYEYRNRKVTDRIDAVIDQVLDEKAREGPRHATLPTKHGKAIANNYDAPNPGARGVHIRRALEAAGILTTLDAYDISPKGYTGAHYAVWPPELVRQLIDEMCPRRVCVECGMPSRRIVGEATYVHDGRIVDPVFEGGPRGSGAGISVAGTPAAGIARGATRQAPTLGWSDCGHGDQWRHGRVLDPFVGSGTTLAVASGMSRDSVGIDLDERNANLCAERVGMFLEVDYPTREVPA